MRRLGGLLVKLPKIKDTFGYRDTCRRRRATILINNTGNLVSIEAFELEVEHGCRFVIGGNPEEVRKLFNKLLDKMRRGPSRKHIEVEEFDALPGMLDEMEARGVILAKREAGHSISTWIS